MAGSLNTPNTSALIERRSNTNEFEVAQDNKNYIKFEGLDPVLGTLGIMIGLLLKEESAEDTYLLDPEWFTDPYNKTKKGITKNGQQMGPLIGQLLGSFGGNALGIPIKDPAILGTWYPIQLKNKTSEAFEPTGLYVVSTDNKVKDEVVTTAIGIGVLKKWEFNNEDQEVTESKKDTNKKEDKKIDKDANSDKKDQGIKVEVWASLPIVVLGADGVSLTFIDENNVNPVTIGVAAEGVDPENALIKINGIEFNGVKFSSNLFIAPEPKFEVSLEILGLKLAKDDTPKNYSLADLEAITPLEILDTAVNLFIGALSKQFTDKEKELQYFAPLFGFSSHVPDHDEIRLPLMQWIELTENAINQKDAAIPFFNWFNALCSDTNNLKAWLSCFSGFLGITDPLKAVMGKGSRLQPFQSPLIQVDGIGQLNFNLGSGVTGNGDRFLYPGLSFTSKSLQIDTSDAYFMMEADLELAHFRLSTTPNTTTNNAALALNFITNFNLTGKDGDVLLDDYKGISLGKLSGGIAIGALTGAVIPHFELINLTLPAQRGGKTQDDNTPNKFGVVNLLSPDELANIGAVALSAALQELILGKEPGSFRNGIAVLLGLKEPVSPIEWPIPPFSEAGISNSIKDPIHAWAQYYLTLIEDKTLTNGVRPFTYLLKAFAQMLEIGGSSLDVTGGGTPDNPWKVGLTVNGSDMPVHLIAYEDTSDSNDTVSLVFGLSLIPELQLDGIKIVPNITIETIQIDLFKDKPAAASWFHKAQATISLPDGFTTPKFGDATIGVTNVALSGGWYQTTGWSWSMLIDNPTLSIGSNKPIVGASLNFSEQSSWSNLVKEGVEAFGPFFTGALGLAMMRSKTRVGLLTAASFGLLTDFSEYSIFQESGLKWEGFKGLKLDDFGDPLQLIRSQLAGNLETPSHAQRFLSLLSWSLTNQAKAPKILGVGSFADPYLTPLPLGFDLPISYNEATQSIGLGLAKNLTYEYNTTDFKFKVAVSNRLNGIVYGLADGSFPKNDQTPSLVNSVLLTNVNTAEHLITLPDDLGYLGALELGFKITLIDDTLDFEPTLVLKNTRLEGQKAAADIDLATYLAESKHVQSAFMSMLNTGLQKVFKVVSNKDLFKDVYSVLSELGLTLDYNFSAKNKVAPGVLGINIGGWQSLLANPKTFMETQLIGLMGKPDSGNQLTELVSTLTGFKFPDVPLPALQLLSGLGIVGSEEDNFVFNLKTLLNIVTDPVEELKRRFEELFTNTANRQALAKQLTRTIPETEVGFFVFSANNNGLVSFKIPEEKPLNFGAVTGRDDKEYPFVSLFGGIDLSFANDSLEVQINSRVPLLNLALQNSFTISLQGNQIVLPTPAISISWGDGKKPAAPPFVILPIDKNKSTSSFYTDQFTTLAPAYAINTISNAVFESALLDKYPLVQHIFSMLGIAKPISNDPPEVLLAESEATVPMTMQSILGLLTDPLGWLLSDQVLGTNGRFNIAKLTNKLALIPEKSFTPASGNPITIGPNTHKTGMLLKGLPYNFSIEISGSVTDIKKENIHNTDVALFKFGCSAIDIADSASVNDLSFAVRVTPDFQAAISGGAKLATGAAGGLFIDFEYDNDFKFSFAGGTPKNPSGVVQLIPFTGWGALAGQAGTLATTKVIEQVVPVILEKLKPKAPDFVTALTDFGTNVPVKNLINTIANLVSNPPAEQLLGEAIEEAALNWIKGLFIEDQLTKTIVAIQGIFAQVPEQIGTVTVDTKEKGLLVFSPGVNLPIELFFGVDGENLGLWVGLNIPKIPYLSMNVLRTGIGIDVATLSKVSISFGSQIILPLDQSYGPGIKLERNKDSEFSLILDPMANSKDPDTNSDMAIQLLPVFFGTKGEEPEDLGETIQAWTLQVIKNVLPRYVSILVLNNEFVKMWLEYNLFTKVPHTEIELSAAQILVATTLICDGDSCNSTKKEEETRYVLNTIDKIADITPLGFLSNLLQELLSETVTIVKIGEQGSISIGPKSDPNPDNLYGINIHMPDFKIEKAPNMVLQFGATNSEWIDQTSQITMVTGSESGSATAKAESKTKGNIAVKKADDTKKSLKPGIQFYVPITINNSVPEIDFDQFNIVLGNIGFDVVGKNGQPIVDLSRFKLGGVQPRVLLDFQFKGKNTPEVTFGGNLTLADMGLSLAPNTLSSGNDQGEKSNTKNPIASNLLGSGSEGDDSKNQPSNPTFSIQAAYTQNFASDQGNLWVNLANPTGEGKQIIFPIQRSFGPLFIDDLGVGWNDKEKDRPLLDVLFSGNVDLAGLKIDLIGLDVGIPVKTPADFGAYEISLQGMDVSFNGGAVTINGGLLKQDYEDTVIYNGAAVIKAASFSLMALGSYAQIKNTNNNNVTSLFIFGAIDIPLGGPPAFFITGLAAGFGFNRDIQIPPITEVMNFPLITGMLNGDLSSSDNPESALAYLGDLVTPRVGQYWLAAGIKFKSFELINTAALLFVQFGVNFEINILGLSYAALPPETKQENALAYFELALKVSIKPDAGVISVEAMLTPNSFVLTKDCKVTGGFAFYLWFKNTTQLVDGKTVLVPKGQFVITLGGYHPKFKAPVYYPKVPRLGLMWNMDFDVASLSINGGAYFTICPTAVMAGGYLDAVFKAGPLKAWFSAYANFLIEWKPFYFDVGIGVTVGVLFGVTIAGVDITLSVQMSAVLELQGPPVGGFIKVDWVVISFTIPFGDKKPDTSDNNLGSWDAFAESFLPQSESEKDINKPVQPLLKAGARDAKAAYTDPKKQQVLKWNSGAGLLNANAKQIPDDQTPWTVNTMFYSFNIKSVVPVNVLNAQLTEEPSDLYSINGVSSIGVRPMGFTKNLKSPVLVTVKYLDGTVVNLKKRHLLPEASLDGSPAALWSQMKLSKSAPPGGDNMIIVDTLVGATITANTFIIKDTIPAFDLINLKYTKNSPRLLPFAKTPVYSGLSTPLSQTLPYTQIMNTIMADGTNETSNIIERRNNIYKSLQQIPAYPIPTSFGPDKTKFSSLQEALLKTRAIVGINAPLFPDLSVMAHAANLIFQVFPTMATVGMYQNKGQITPPKPYQPEEIAVKSFDSIADYKQPKLEGVLRRHISNEALGEHIIKGSRILSKWTNKAQLDLNQSLQMARFGESRKNSVETKRLYEGGAYIWRLDSRKSHKIKLDGNLEAIAYYFDNADNLIGKHLVSPNKQFKIEQGTAQVAILAHDPGIHSSVGWQLDTKVAKINSKWAMTDGSLICVQNAQRVKLSEARSLTGVIRMNSMLAQNQVLALNDELVPGWIQTSCFTQDKYIGVLLDSDQDNSIQVSTATNNLPEILGNGKRVKIIPCNGKFVHVYKLREHKDEKQIYAGIIVKPTDSRTTVHAIYSMKPKDFTRKKSLEQQSIVQQALNTCEREHKTSNISVTG